MEINREEAKLIVESLVCEYNEYGAEKDIPAIRSLVKRLEALHRGILDEIYEGLLPRVCF